MYKWPLMKVNASSLYIVCLLHLTPFCYWTQYSLHGYFLGAIIPLNPISTLTIDSVQMYDYACSFHEEVILITLRSTSFLISCRFKWTFLLRSGWSRIKFLYVVTRYVPFLLFAAHLYSTSFQQVCDTINSLTFQWTLSQTKLLMYVDSHNEQELCSLECQLRDVNLLTTSAHVPQRIYLKCLFTDYSIYHRF